MHESDELISMEKSRVVDGKEEKQSEIQKFTLRRAICPTITAPGTYQADGQTYAPAGKEYAPVYPQTPRPYGSDDMRNVLCGGYLGSMEGPRKMFGC